MGLSGEFADQDGSLRWFRTAPTGAPGARFGGDVLEAIQASLSALESMRSAEAPARNAFSCLANALKDVNVMLER